MGYVDARRRKSDNLTDTPVKNLLATKNTRIDKKISDDLGCGGISLIKRMEEGNGKG